MLDADIQNVSKGIDIMSIDKKFRAENLEQCDSNYVPPIGKYITCEQFGNSDGMDSACWWCKEMTPYQWYMCLDETLLRHLTSRRTNPLTTEQAQEYIDKVKKRRNEYDKRS